MKTIITSAAFALIANNATAQFKCSDSTGRTSYQQTPCTDGTGQRIQVQTAPSPTVAASGVPKWKTDAMAVDKRSNIRIAIEQRRPLIGMTIEELTQALGLPNSINSGAYQSGSSEQRVFYRTEATYFVYTSKGLVTDVQTSQGGLGTTAANKGPCPSGQEIRNLETSASSITIGDVQKKIYADQLAKMRDCK